jgi:tetratricopeptide (TPR) repeat protein
MNGPTTVAAAIIVRDEQRFLPGCLDSLAGRVDDIVIVDTGSTDATIEIASRPDVRLIHHVWQQDFAAARNVGLDAVTSDWVLYIDADERLNLPQGGRLADYIDPASVAGFVRFQPKTGYTRYWERRLFRSDPRIRFVGKIHETMVAGIERVRSEEGLVVVQTTVKIDHLGYDGDQSRKHGRNLPLLEAAARADPRRTYYWHHLVETLAATGRPEEAAAAAEQGIASAERAAGAEQSAAASLIYQYLARVEVERGGNPLPVIAKALERVPDDYALWHMRGHALLAVDQPAEALEVATRLLAIDPERLDGWLAFEAGLFGDLACELAALSCLRLGRRSRAAAYFAKAAKLAPHEPSYRTNAVALGGPRILRTLS